jgi:hypothetical protein
MPCARLLGPFRLRRALARLVDPCCGVLRLSGDPRPLGTAAVQHLRRPPAGLAPSPCTAACRQTGVVAFPSRLGVAPRRFNDTEGAFMIRSRCRTSLLALLALLALGATASASASAALPEFSPEGTTKTPVKFSLKSSLVTIQSDNFVIDLGRYGEGYGEIVGPKEVQNVVLTLSEPTNECSTDKNKLTFEKLKGRLGYVNKAKHEVGLLLEPEKAGANVLECNGLFFKWIGGSAIGTTEPVNKPGKRFFLGFQGGSEYHQLVQSFEGEEARHDLTALFSGHDYSSYLTMGLELERFEQAKKSIELEIKG